MFFATVSILVAVDVSPLHSKSLRSLVPVGASAGPRFFSLSSPKGGEGRGEEADYSSSNPLAPALSPLGRGEGVGGSAKMRLVPVVLQL
jgi:hypothetical protein